MARMNVVLRQSVENIGDVGEVVTVAGGYARNYLIPRGLAVPATKGNVKEAEAIKARVAEQIGREREGAEQLKEQLEAGPVQIAARSGPDGRLFGSVTTTQISEAVSEQLGVEVDRHVIELADPIKSLGRHEVTARLHAEVRATITVDVAEG